MLHKAPRSLCQRLLEHRLELGGDGFEQGNEVGLAIVWEGEDLLHCVDFPAEDDLLCAPGGVAFVELLEGDWFLPCDVVLVVRAEEFVDGAKEVSRHLPSLCWPPLCYTDESIKVYCGVC